MFRNPRENASRLPDERVQPYVGRPPSPPSSPDGRTPKSKTDKMTTEAARVTSPTKLGTPNRGSPPSSKAIKAKPKGNSSILSFFKKADNAADGDTGGLFVEEAVKASRNPNVGHILAGSAATKASDPSDGAVRNDESAGRFNESPNSVKRQKTSQSSSLNGQDSSEDGSATAFDNHGCTPPPSDVVEAAPDDIHDQDRGVNGPPNCTSGPFLDESDSEDEEAKKPTDEKKHEQERSREAKQKERCHPPLQIPLNDTEHNGNSSTEARIPTLKREGTSIISQDGFADFEGMEDFEDEYEEGEEFVERRYMMEQRRLEAEADIDDDMGDEEMLNVKDEPEDEANGAVDGAQQSDGADEAGPSCPICGVQLRGVSDQEASVHVNNCLDGNPTPLPQSKKPEGPKKEKESETFAPFKRFVRPPKPGQKNPFVVAQPSDGGSAFSKLMSGHSEETAWSAAAASERVSRGKPSYQRTCPFYKILDGYFICVDAFRYGAVSGCNAYFLSHFHSDHYVGLTSTWSHGKIYCSRITANLVRQQLRVDPKWVVDLEWEEKVEVPGTQGVQVTMIPANHCPGSSLYLFEKNVDPPKSAPSTAKPRTERILHCGDFRACPAHLAHPKLMPEVLDSLTGKLKHQKIDKCYLDTTYLSPKYAFPSQEEVITACADMCSSLSKEKVDASDGFEQMKRERAGSTMTKFVRKDSKDEQDEDAVASEAGAPEAKKSRGQLLVVVGTYSIGKERICLGIARALNSKIYAPANKQRICAALQDPELNNRLTKDPYAAQVHMTPLFEIRAETLSEYLAEYKGHFSRAVGFRPSGWNYRPPGSRSTEAPTVQQILHSPGWKSTYSMKNLIPQRGSSSKSQVFGVPYSEHSSFRELTMFVCGLHIEKVIPTVNVGSAVSRQRMKQWIDRWQADKRKNGLFRVKKPDDPVKMEEGRDEAGEFYPGKGTWELRTTL